MTKEEVLQILNNVGAVITDSHIVYTSWRHGTAYIDKDMDYPHTREIAQLCHAIALEFYQSGVEAVVGPEKGAIILSQWTAHSLCDRTSRNVLSFYAEKAEGDTFVIKRGGAAKFLPGKNVLVVEDVLTTGGSAKKVIEVVRAMGGNVVGLGVLCNRGGVTPEDVANPPKLFALVNMNLDSWDEEECARVGPCSKNVPINTEVGEGREYLARKGK